MLFRDLGGCLWGEQVTILPRHMYSRDPLEILIDDEARTCKGCKRHIKTIIIGEVRMVCEKNRKKRDSKCYEETMGKVYCGGGK